MASLQTAAELRFPDCKYRSGKLSQWMAPLCPGITHACQVIVSNSCSPVDCSSPGSSVMGFSRQEYWSRLPLPSPGDLSDTRIESESPTLQADSLPTELSGKPKVYSKYACKSQLCILFCSLLGPMQSATTALT